MSSSLRRLISASALAWSIAIAVTPVSAGERNEVWPEIDGFFTLDDRTRLFLMGAFTRSEEKEFVAGTTRFESRQFGAHLDFTLNPIFRVALQDDDWERNRYLWLRVGYRHLDDPGDTSADENRGLLELNSREPLPANIWLTGRLKWEMREIGSTYSNRFGARLGMERPFILAGHSLAPYFHIETLYDTRFDTWNRQRYQAGIDISINAHWRVEPYLARQDDEQPVANHVNALGITLKYSQ